MQVHLPNMPTLQPLALVTDYPPRVSHLRDISNAHSAA